MFSSESNDNETISGPAKNSVTDAVDAERAPSSEERNKSTAQDKSDPARTEAATEGTQQKPKLSSVFEALEVVAEAIIVKLREPSNVTAWQKTRKGFVQFAKDVGPFVTGVASILASIVVGLLTLAVTAGVSYFTYQFNTKQAAVTQTTLKTAALADFAEGDDGKRTLAAIKLAAYGEDALPAIRLALGVTHEGIRAGGVQTAEIIYQSRPDVRERLISEMLNYFQERNSTLRLGVLEFYVKVAPQLTRIERQTFLSRLKQRLGNHAESCTNEDGEFVLKSATFLTQGPFPEARELLWDIAQNCPHEKGNGAYEGARNQAVIMLPIVVKQQNLPKAEREAIIAGLHQLEADASEELKGNIETAIDEIKNSQGP